MTSENSLVPQQVVGGQQFLPAPTQPVTNQQQPQQQHHQCQIALVNVQPPRR